MPPLRLDPPSVHEPHRTSLVSVTVEEIQDQCAAQKCTPILTSVVTNHVPTGRAERERARLYSEGGDCGKTIALMRPNPIQTRQPELLFTGQATRASRGKSQTTSAH
jgi:hypothetical protein